MNKRLIYLIIFTLVLFGLNALIMPNHDFWINQYPKLHAPFASSMLTLDVMAIGFVYPREIFKLVKRV